MLTREQLRLVDSAIDKVNEKEAEIQRAFLKLSDDSLKTLIKYLRERVLNRRMKQLTKSENNFDAVLTFIQGFDAYKKLNSDQQELIKKLIDLYLAIAEIRIKLEEMKNTGNYSGLSDNDLNERMQEVKKNLPKSSIFSKDKKTLTNLADSLAWVSGPIDTVVKSIPKTNPPDTKPDRRDDLLLITIGAKKRVPQEQSKFEHIIINQLESGTFPNLARPNSPLVDWETALRQEPTPPSAEPSNEPEATSESSDEPEATSEPESASGSGSGSEPQPNDQTPPRQRKIWKNYVFPILGTALTCAVVGVGLGAVAGFASLGVGLIITIPAGAAAGFLIGLFGSTISCCLFNKCCGGDEKVASPKEQSTTTLKRGFDSSENLNRRDQSHENVAARNPNSQREPPTSEYGSNTRYSGTLTKNMSPCKTASTKERESSLEKRGMKINA